MRYIVTKDNKVIGTIENGDPNLDDMKSRGERLVESTINISPHLAIFQSGKIIQRQLTSEEIEVQKKLKESVEEFQKKIKEIIEPKQKLSKK